MRARPNFSRLSPKGHTQNEHVQKGILLCGEMDLKVAQFLVAEVEITRSERECSI